AMRHPGTFRAVGSHAGDMGFEWCYRPDIPAALRHLEQFDHLDDFIETIGQRDTGGKDWFPALNIVAMAACYSPGEHGESVLPVEPYTGDLRPEVWARWLAHDPVTLAADHLDILRDLDLLYFDCGTGDEFNLFLGARALHQVLEENGVEHRYDEFDGGHHGLNWRYEFSLPLLTRALA
ncbi:MAG: alpha/beta hydrolase-fold protein, partial [Anaerolineae bacterium]